MTTEEQNYIFLEIECLEHDLSKIKDYNIEEFNSYVKTLGISKRELETLSYYDIAEEYKLNFRPEYSNLIGFSLGYYKNDKKSILCKFSFDNELELLEELKTKLDSFNSKNYILAGFSLSDNKIPYLTKKFIYNGIKPPIMFNDYKLKPWEKKNIDLSELTKFGSFKQTTSLNDLAFGFGIPYLYDRQHILEIINENGNNLEIYGLLKVQLENKIKTVMDVTSKLNELL